MIINGSLNFIGVLIAAAVSWHLCLNKNHANPIAPKLLSVATVIVLCRTPSAPHCRRVKKMRW